MMLHTITTQKTSTYIFTTVKTSYFTSALFIINGYIHNCYHITYLL